MEYSFLKHKIFLLSIFILGNTIIVFPRGAGIETAVYSVILALLPTIFISYFLAKSSLNLNDIPKFLNVVIIAFCLFVFILTATDYISFVDSIRLPKTSRFIISLLFVFVSIILGLSKRKVIFLFCLFSFLITAVIFLLIFIVSIKDFDFSVLKIQTTNTKVLTRQTLTFFIHSFGQVLIPLFLVNDKKINNKKILTFGLIFSFVLMLIYVLNIILVLGASVTSSVDYPYATLTSFISFGRNFSRLDGFTYYVYFFSSLIKCSVCFAVILNYFSSNKKTAAIIITAVLLIGCNLIFLQEFIHTDIVNLVVMILEIMLPIGIFSYQKIKSHRR